jgi:small-conductance mechanosensitive channel
LQNGHKIRLTDLQFILKKAAFSLPFYFKIKSFLFGFIIVKYFDILVTIMDVNKNQKQEIEHKAEKKKKKYSFIWLGTYIVIAVIAVVFYFLFGFHIFDLLGTYRVKFKNLSLAVFFGVLILIVAKFIEIRIHNRSKGRYTRYNLIHLTKFVSFIAVAMVVISFLNSNWYAAAVSLGLISLVLGFALQTPISSFIGWIYIIIRNPYRIGDRIEINQFKGDVIEIGYVDTTLWEFAGDYLTNDLPSGRLIRFPNTMVLQSAVFNYSWQNFKFIWNEIPFHVAYESDLNFVEKIIKQVTSSELGPQMADRITQLKKMVEDSPINEMEIKEYPYVSFRIDENTWVEVTVTYLVPPRKAATIRTEIIRKILAEFNKSPDKVLFPNGNSR